MKYDMIQIIPSFHRDDWTVSFGKDNTQRLKTKTEPNSLGFFYYSPRLGKEKAFLLLKDKIVKEHEAKIEKLTKSLEKLKKLEYERKTTNN